ncbi:MAG TPA: 50S ribosomal protein L25 [Candidatus Dormibacteraeota bacterium]|jgi:large subunit ribosomal protein L25|nr:50S ribosomal protein L25 [Candidatus Dormibacteraeota bacterium]
MKLKAKNRELTGKAARRLRHEGLLPAVVYGQGHKPKNLELDEREFGRVFARAGHTQLVDLVVESGRPQKVLIKAVQISPRKNSPIHVDFHQLSLREKMQIEVPLTFVGEAVGVRLGNGDLLPLSQSLRVETLPTTIPESIEIDVSGLEEADATIHVSDVVLPEGVTAVEDGDTPLVKLQPHRVSEAGEEAEGAGEGEAPAEGAEDSTEA